MNSFFYDDALLSDWDLEEPEVIEKNIDPFLLDLCGRNTRNIAIISNRTCERKGRKYLKIVGLDIFTGKIVSLIDNHGKSYGLCSFSKEWAMLKTKTVIKVSVELCENVFINVGKNQNAKLTNALRIKGQYEVLGKTDWVELVEKYKLLLYFQQIKVGELLAKPVSATRIFRCFKDCENLVVYLPIFFNGTHRINIDGSKALLYNPENKKSFEFISVMKKLIDNKDKYLNGIVIAKLTVTYGKTTLLIDMPMSCKYFNYSKTERREKARLNQLKYYLNDLYMNNPPYDDYDDETDYSEKYRPYESMAEFCDEYEEFYENLYSDGACYEDLIRDQLGNIKTPGDEDY